MATNNEYLDSIISIANRLKRKIENIKTEKDCERVCEDLEDIKIDVHQVEKNVEEIWRGIVK